MRNTLLEWRDEFSLGIADIDHEHRQLIDLINRLYDELLRCGDGTDAGAFFGELCARITAHFALEEKLMREHRYSEYGAHKDDHEALLDEIQTLMDAHGEGEWRDSGELSKVLSDWFTAHFRSFDARLHKALPLHAD